MSYGINVQNQNGITLIDESYSSYVVKEEGSLTNGSMPPTLLDKELVFYSPNSNGNHATICHLDGGYFSIVGSLRYVIVRPVSSQPVSSERYGVRVYGEFGQNVFDSGARLMNPVGMYSHNVLSSSTYTLPVSRLGRRMWFSQNVFKFADCQDTGIGFGDAYSTGLRRNSDTSYTVAVFGSYMGPPFTFTSSIGTYQFLVMEV